MMYLQRGARQLLSPKGQELVTMFSLNSKLASTSSHVTYGWLTSHLQGVRPSYEGSSLPDQEASNAFPPFHCWNPCSIRQCPSYPTAIPNFYRYLLKGVPHRKAVSGQFSLCITIFRKYLMLSKLLSLLGVGVRFLSHLKVRVSATPAPRRNR